MLCSFPDRAVSKKWTLVPLMCLVVSNTAALPLDMRVDHHQTYTTVDMLQMLAEARAKFPGSLEKDRLIFEKKIADLSVSYLDLRKGEFEALNQLSIDSAGGAVQLKDFFARSAAFQSAREYASEKLDVLATFQETWNASHTDAPIDLSELILHYQRKVQELDSRAAALNFSIVLPTGAIAKQQGLDPTTLRQMNLYTADQLIAMREKATTLKIMRTSDRRRINQTLNQFTVAKIQAFLNAYGATQKHRDRNTEAQIDAARKELEEMMWLRSYIRAVYGMKIGSYGLVDVHKKWFNMDSFGRTALRFSGQPIYDENTLMVQQDLALAVVAGQEGKNAEILSLSTPFFTRIASVLTFFSGEKQWAAVNVQVLKLLIADIEEERILGRAGGLRELRVHYKRRYYSSKADEAYYQALADAYLPSAADEDDPEADVVSVDSHSMRGVLGAALVALENQEDRINQAQAIEATLHQLNADSKVKARRNARRRI